MNEHTTLNPSAGWFAHIAKSSLRPNIIPVIPPDAPIHPSSSIKKGGKAPGRRSADGFWRGIKGWETAPTLTDAEIAEHDISGASLGICGGIEGVVGIDLDITDVSVRDAMITHVEKVLGARPLVRDVTRVGHVNVLLACRVLDLFGQPATVGSGDMAFLLPDGVTINKVQLLGAKKQFVAFGRHVDGGEYRWDRNLAETRLPEVAETDLEALWEGLPTALMAAGCTFAGKGKVKIKAGTLSKSAKGDRTPQRCSVAEAALWLSLLPNDPLVFDYDGYINDIGLPLYGATNGSEAGKEIWIDWCSTVEQEKYDPADKWKTFGNTHIGIDKIKQLAWDRDPAGAQRINQQLARMAFTPISDVSGEATGRLLRTVKASSFAGKPLPTREFLDEQTHFFPMRKLTLFTGVGGAGKTLAALQLSVACASKDGKWLGYGVKHGPVLFYSAEEDADELHLRIADICTAEGIDLAALNDLELADMTLDVAHLLVPLPGDKTRLMDTEALQEMERTIAATKPVLVVIDNRGQTIKGSEIDRNVATEAVNRLQQLGRRYGCAIVLLAHPSLSGIAHKTGTSGSTGWVNTGRGQVDMVRPDDADDTDDDGRRILINRKGNYSKTGTRIELRWEHWRYVNTSPGIATAPGGVSASAAMKAARRAEAETAFLDMLEKAARHKENVSPSRSSGNYAPKRFNMTPPGNRFGQKALAEAMDALLASKAISIEQYGRPAQPIYRLAIRPAANPSEENVDK